MYRGRNIQGAKAHVRSDDGMLHSFAAKQNVELGRKDDIDEGSTLGENSEQLAASRYPVTGKAQT